MIPVVAWLVSLGQWAQGHQAVIVPVMGIVVLVLSLAQVGRSWYSWRHRS
jgi:hypothetical protein